ncbi:unnamed protein product [Rotaria socialis]|uniref:Uncharacterized protein n=1 Tax=Rotaria socialis TaxID=392032 RepID=A0A818BQV9_9BILA|nr:unnamed protein product [Rotaria socialis]
MLRRWKNRFPCYNKINAHQLYTSIDSELKYVYSKLEILSNENNLLRSHFDKLQERYEHWINDEQIYLMQRIEKLENENQYLRETYQTYQIQNEKCIQSITNLIIKMLSNQKELRKTHGEQDDANDTTQSNKNQQKNQLSTRSTSCTSCHIVRNRSDDSQYTISTTTTTNNNKNHNESIWPHQRLMIVEDQDQKTTNQSSELNPNSSTLATTKSKFNKSSAGSTNKLYFVLNDEKLTQDNRHSKSVNIVPMDDSHSAHAAKQRSSTLTMTLNKTRASRQQKTNPIYSNHERLSVQTPSIPKSTPTKITTCISKPSRIPTTKTRPPPPTIRQRPPISTVTNQKTVSASVTTNKSPSPRVTSVKPGESVRNTTTTIPNRPIINTTKTTTNIYNKIPVTTVVKQRARVSDLDALMTEQRKSTSKLVNKSPVVLPSSITNNIRKSLFSKDTVKRVQPVRSHELKLFSCHLTPDVSSQNDESILTLTPCSLESIKDNQLVETKDQYTNQSSTIAAVMKRDFSEDSLNEHDHIQKLLQQKASNNTRNHSLIDSSQTCTDTIYLDDPIQNENNREGYFLSANDNSNSGHADSSIDLSSINSKSFASSSSSKPLVHRLIFPARLGRVVFFRRILSDTDIYQKNCSKDNEIYHNVYHLDSVRDFSMEFYMLATYTSDSQLRAWVDDDDDDVVNNVCHLDEDLFQRNEQDSSDNQTRTSQSRDSLNRDNEELDWYSELEIPNLTLNNQHERSENVSTCSSEMHPSRLLVDEQFPISSLTTITSDSTDITSPSSILSNNTSNGLHSNPAPSNIIDQTNALLREIFHTSYRLHVSSSSSIPQETNDDHNENDSQTSSIITNEFQPDFYYLCPITSTTNFSKTDFKPLYHDV